MLNEIRSKWVVKYKAWDVIITKDNEVYDVATKSKLIPTYDNGRIAHRLQGSTKRIGELTMKKHCKKEEVVIQYYTPF